MNGVGRKWTEIVHIKISAYSTEFLCFPSLINWLAPGIGGAARATRTIDPESSGRDRNVTGADIQRIASSIRGRKQRRFQKMIVPKMLCKSIRSGDSIRQARPLVPAFARTAQQRKRPAEAGRSTASLAQMSYLRRPSF
jgi:hypothetical protein